MQYRRIRPEGEDSAIPAGLVGLGIGIAVGFLVGELFAGEGHRAVRRALRPLRRAKAQPHPAELTADIRETLTKVIGPDAQSVNLVHVGRNALEIQGWVGSRARRTKAIRTVREALDPGIKLVDRLLVWGEDDAATPVIPLREEPESA